MTQNSCQATTLKSIYISHRRNSRNQTAATRSLETSLGFSSSERKRTTTNERTVLDRAGPKEVLDRAENYTGKETEKGAFGRPGERRE
jgi:hypothetical protein